MAYMNQENKAKLAVEIAKVMPTGWKYSLKVQNHSTLVVTIRQADVDLIKENNRTWKLSDGRPTHISLNEHHLQGEYSGKLLKIFESIKGAMMIGNHDNSDMQSDYFDVGWYTTIQIGEWDSPFRFEPKNSMNNIAALKASLPIPKPAIAQGDLWRLCDFRPEGMPVGLSRAEEIAWMKNRIAQLEAR